MVLIEPGKHSCMHTSHGWAPAFHAQDMLHTTAHGVATGHEAASFAELGYFGPTMGPPQKM